MQAQRFLLKALADRLAEALAERMHERVRKEFWGYAADERFSNDELIAESYRGIRPAPGYPASPDHTTKRALFDLLQAEKNAKIDLTDSYAMLPTAAVSGFYFSHPTAAYFGIGKIERDQVEDYAKRKGMTLSEAERWLAPIRPGGSWLMLKALPLLLPLPGLLKGKRYAYQWSSLLILLYLCEGLVRATSDRGPSQWLAVLETMLATIFFISVLAFCRATRPDRKSVV